MEEYDPSRDLAADEWLDLDEQERMILVEDYHRRHRIRMPSVEGHAVAHTIVETQLALGEPVSSLHVLAYALKASIVTTPFTPSARAWQAKQRRRVTLACRWRLQIPPVM
jgi:hypothetical protein